MKKYLLIASIVSIFLFTGCGLKEPQVGENQNLITLTKHKIGNSEHFNAGVSINTKAEAIEKVAVLIQRVSKEFDEVGIKYFTISNNYLGMDKVKNGISPFITDIESLNQYCFNTDNGLELKCEPLTFDSVRLYFFGSLEPIYTKPTWSVKQVLSDSKIEEYTKKFQSEITVIK